MAHCRFLPSSDFVAFRCNHIGYAGDEIFFNLVSGCESFLCHQTLHCGRFRPWVFRHFVAAHVDVWQWDAGFTIHQDNLVNNFFHQSVGAFHRRVEHVVVVSLCRLVFRRVVVIPHLEISGSLRISVFQIAAACLHRHDCCAGVSRRFDFWYHFHSACIGIA